MSGKFSVYLECFEFICKVLGFCGKFPDNVQISSQYGRFPDCLESFSDCLESFPDCLESFVHFLDIFQFIWNVKSLTDKFLDKNKGFQPIQKLFGLSKNFTDFLKSVPDFWKVSS